MLKRKIPDFSRFTASSTELSTNNHNRLIVIYSTQISSQKNKNPTKQIHLNTWGVSPRRVGILSRNPAEQFTIETTTKLGRVFLFFVYSS
jgi:hypothetical protein